MIFTILFPLIILVLSLFPTMKSGNGKDINVIALANFGKDFAELAEKLNDSYLSTHDYRIIFVTYSQDDITNKIKSGHFDAAILQANAPGSKIKLYRSPRLPDSTALKLQSFIKQTEAIYSGSDTNAFENGLKDFRTITVERENFSASLTSFYYSFSFLVLLSFLSLFSGGTFVRSFLYEKSNGLVELYFSSVSGKELVTGKLLGLIFIGLMQTTIWIIIGLLAAGNMLPESIVTAQFFIRIIYFVLGYILYSTLFLAAGSLITNEYQAQQVTALLSIIMIFPLLTSVEIMSSPNSVVSEFLTYFPLTTAPLAIIRSGLGELSSTSTIITLSIIVVSIYTGILVSSKLYTASVLVNTGKIKLRNLKSILKD